MSKQSRYLSPNPRRNRPPKGEAWIWMTCTMLESDAYRGLGINAHRVLNFLMIEHMCHGGTENGNLVAPYKQLVAFGVSKSEISSAIVQLVAFGLIEVKKGKRLGGRTHASRYRLTWLPTHEGEPPTNRWLSLTRADVLQFREENRRRRSPAKERRRARNKVIALTDHKLSEGMEILKGGREVEPGFVRKVEPAEGDTSTRSSAGAVGN